MISFMDLSLSQRLTVTRSVSTMFVAGEMYLSCILFLFGCILFSVTPAANQNNEKLLFLLFLLAIVLFVRRFAASNCPFGIFILFLSYNCQILRTTCNKEVNRTSVLPYYGSNLVPDSCRVNIRTFLLFLVTFGSCFGLFDIAG